VQKGVYEHSVCHLSSPNSSSKTESAISILPLRAQASTSAVAAIASGCTPSRAISASCSVASRGRPARPCGGA
jgi:hypothetical protein